MKITHNTLQKYILDNSVKDYTKKTVTGLFRSILEPIISNQKFEAHIFFRLFDLEEKESIIKRLEFSGAKIHSYNDNLKDYNLTSEEENEIWGKTEFTIILGQRYSVALIWDYELSQTSGYTPVCLIYNSSKITEIIKTIADNSKTDLKEIIGKYTPDRRENSILNKSVKNIADLLNDKNEELTFSEAEKNHEEDKNETLKNATAVSEKAKFIAHEIKNNLSVINLYTKITEKRFEKIEANAETQESVNTALKNVQKASESISYLINDLRCLSLPHISEVDIKNIIFNTIMLCEEKAKNKNINIEIKNIIDETLNTDKVKIECAIMNIIYNAIEACDFGREIEIDTVKTSDFYEIIISNNGEPIKKENINKIFIPDFTTKEKGNGLGLAICKNQLNLIGGDIELIGSDEEKTSFKIKILIK